MHNDNEPVHVEREFVTIQGLHGYKHKALQVRAVLDCGTLYAVEVVCKLYTLNRTHLHIICDTIAYDERNER